MDSVKRHNFLVNTSVVVSVVAIGIVIASVLPRDAPTAEDDLAQAGAAIVGEPIEFPVDIPGCDSVLQPPRDSGYRRFSVSSAADEASYGNPSYPWLTAGKAAMMSDAVRAALPPDVTIRLAAPSRSFIFQPIVDFGSDLSIAIPPESTATGELVRGISSSYTSIGVSQSSTGVPACVADARAVELDGTVVDTLDTWHEDRGTRTYTRSAIGYHPDGTRVSVQLSGGSPSEIPLELDDAARIAALPQLAISDLAPVGTVAAVRDCSVEASDNWTVSEVRRESVDAANVALTASWRAISNAPTLDRPIGSLVPDGFSAGVCTDLRVTDPQVAGTELGLFVSVIGDQPLPVAVDPNDPAAEYDLMVPQRMRMLPDGSIVQIRDIERLIIPLSQNGTRRLTRSVTVTRPSGVQVSVRSTANIEPSRVPRVSPEPLPRALLETLAQTPIERWP